MPSDILKKIVATKHEEVADARRKIPENRLREEAQAPRDKRPFFDRLAAPGPGGVNIVAEIKRASPSKGIIQGDLDEAVQALRYERGGAAALSVLTDRTYFKGSFEDLKVARESCHLPVLRKDFIVSEYQIYESAVMGADAILLIVRILTETQLSDYLALAQEFGLDVLVETHSESEIRTASRAGARLVGINNRNLSSFETSIDTSVRLASLLSPDQTAVAESGIHGPDDIRNLKAAGFHNFLIGESLVRAEDPAGFLKELIMTGGGPG